MPGALSLGVKPLLREPDHSPLRAEVKNELQLHSPIFLRGVHWDNFNVNRQLVCLLSYQLNLLILKEARVQLGHVACDFKS